MEQHIKEAQKLINKIHQALQAMAFNREDYKESEVLFRLESIRGMLIIAHNDATEMLRVWKRGK